MSSSQQRVFKLWMFVLAILACTTVATAFWRYARAPEEGRTSPAVQTKLELPHVVRSIHQVDNYTYLELMDSPDSSYWIASPRVAAEVGDQVFYHTGQEMQDFESRGLGVTFERILFVDLVHAVSPEGDVRAGSDHSRAAPLRREAAALGDSFAPDFDPRHDAPPADRP